MYTILVVILVLVSVALIALILLQHGKGADAGATFGSGASGTVFGARGSASFLTKVTGWLVTAFFVITLVLAYLSTHRTVAGNSVVDRMQGAAASHMQTTAVKPAAPVSVSAPPAATTAVSPAAKHDSVPAPTTSTAKPAASK